jgi:hypothetical protein
MSDEEVIEGALYLLRVATSTELGRYYVAQALKASGLFDDNVMGRPPLSEHNLN